LFPPLLILIVLQSACLQNPLRSDARPIPRIETPQTLPGAATDAGVESTPNVQHAPQQPAQPVAIQAGSGVYLGTERQPPSQAVNSDVEGVSLNFKDMDLQSFVKAVLGDVLGQNYVIDPAVSGKVTIHSVRPLPRDQLLGVMQELLSLNGAAMIHEDGRYRILPAGKAAQAAQVPRVRRLRDLGYGLQIVPLHYIGASEMAEILKPMLQAQGIIHTDTRRNLLILSGSGEQINNLLDTIAIFDVDWLAGKSVTLFPLKEVDPKTLTRDLETALKGSHGELFDGMVRLIPIERVNGLLVVSSTPAFMQELRHWIEKLDVANDKAERRLYVYKLKNAKAADIAGILTSIFSGHGVHPGQRPEAAVIPSQKAVSLESTPSGQPRDVRQQAQQYPAASGDRNGILLSAEKSVRIIADEINNALVVLGTAREYEIVESTIRKLDIMPKQVLIEASIIEVGLTGDLSYGVEWFLKHGGVGKTRQGEAQLSLGTDGIKKIAPGFSYSIVDGMGGIRAVLNALESATDVQVLSSPSLMVLDNKTAKINVGDEIPIPTRQSTSNIDPNAPTVNEIQYRNTGVILTVMPRINAGGLVTLEVTQEVSDAITTSTSGLDAPTIQKRTIDSTVAVQSGESVVLGGLIRDKQENSKSGIPGLSRIPVIGNLFSDHSDSSRRTELLVILTPRVIGNSNEARAITEEYRNKLARPLDTR